MLLIDVGNSRIKWTVLKGRDITAVEYLAHKGEPAQALLSLPTEKPAAIWISSVAGQAQDAAIAEACTARWQMRPNWARSQKQFGPVISAYAEAQRLGIDRWLAMIACFELSQGSCIVADAGTALTVDVLNEQGQHQGGVIAAGLSTSESALLGATRFETRETVQDAHAGLGLDTESCVRQGAMLSCLGVLELLASRAPGARRFIGGGDASTLQPLLSEPWEYRPHMVLEGLAILARDG
tara:strand:+ start:11582 stop:12298 length:717 start_codon:yes stop_codon:yes gene_type:complete